MSDPVQQALEQIAGPRVQYSAAKRSGEASASLSAQHVIVGASRRGALKRLAAQGFTRRHRFGILPSRKAARWLMPLGSHAVTRQSLDICAAYSLPARVLKGLLSVTVKMNWFAWRGSGVVLASKEPLALEALVSEVTGEAAPVFALSIGSLHRYRKVAIQVMRPTGEILGYIKLPLTEAATERVRHEATMLARLQDFANLQPYIPRVLHAGEWGDSYILFQSSGPSGAGPTEFGRAHQEFLHALQKVSQVQKPGQAIAGEVERRWQRLEPQVDRETRQLGRAALGQGRRELDGCSIRCGIHHGDFAPWNTRVEGGRLFLLDWESASLETPVCWDEFHFRIQVEGLLKKRKNGLPASIPGNCRTEFLLYLMNSLCQLLEEDPADRSGIEYRLKLLRESAH